MMKRIYWVLAAAVLFVVSATSSQAAEDLAKKMAGVLAQAPAEKFWQLAPADVAAMVSAKKDDFVIVDVRPNPAEYGEGHIPGAIQITVQDMLKPESLKKLPKNKKIILACVTGQTQNLPIVPLRAMGYNAYTLQFGYAAWLKGYRGGQMMQDAIKNANYPVTK